MTPTPKNLNESNEELKESFAKHMRVLFGYRIYATDVEPKLNALLAATISPLREEIETANRKLSSVIKNYNEKVDQLSAAQSKISSLEQLLSGKNVEGMK